MSATIKRLESKPGALEAHTSTVAALTRALEIAGIQFIENGGGPGVRLRKAEEGQIVQRAGGSPVKPGLRHPVAAEAIIVPRDDQVTCAHLKTHYGLRDGRGCTCPSGRSSRRPPRDRR